MTDFVATTRLIKSSRQIHQKSGIRFVLHFNGGLGMQSAIHKVPHIVWSENRMRNTIEL